jgi:2-isopropylmalate synthase
VNSQSGKGGVAYIMKTEHSMDLPRRLQIEFSQVVQAAADATGKELTSDELAELFSAEYLRTTGPFIYRSHQLAATADGADRERITLHVDRNGTPTTLTGSGSGPIDALVAALGLPMDVLSYSEHSRSAGSGAQAVAYVEITTHSRVTLFGVGIHNNIITASLLAVISAVNRAMARGAMSVAA